MFPRPVVHADHLTFMVRGRRRRRLSRLTRQLGGKGIEMVTNLDELRRMRDAAMAKGAGSKPWIDFATAMLDAFPRLYETAQKMNDEAAHLRAQIYLAVMDERNACIGICAQYRGADGDSIASEIEARLPPNVGAKRGGTACRDDSA